MAHTIMKQCAVAWSFSTVMQSINSVSKWLRQECPRTKGIEIACLSHWMAMVISQKICCLLVILTVQSTWWHMLLMQTFLSMMFLHTNCLSQNFCNATWLPPGIVCISSESPKQNSKCGVARNVIARCQICKSIHINFDEMGSTLHTQCLKQGETFLQICNLAGQNFKIMVSFLSSKTFQSLSDSNDWRISGASCFFVFGFSFSFEVTSKSLKETSCLVMSCIGQEHPAVFCGEHLSLDSPGNLSTIQDTVPRNVIFWNKKSKIITTRATIRADCASALETAFSHLGICLARSKASKKSKLWLLACSSFSLFDAMAWTCFQQDDV